MSKYSRFTLILVILFLTGCNRPQALPKGLPSETELPQAATDTAEPLPVSTQTQLPTYTQPPATEGVDPTQGPPQPTSDIQIDLLGTPIPLLAAAAEITIHEIHMINSQFGWALTQDAEGIDHILRTTNGGYSWRDITPPQPIDPSLTHFGADVSFIDPDTGWAIYYGSDLVWSTENGGITWQVNQLDFRSYMESMLVSLDPNHVWVFQFTEGGMQHVYTALARSQDRGQTWSTLLDPYTDASIQAFDKTGAAFVNSEYGWVTRDFRGVAVYLYLDITNDGGSTWQNLEMPAPPSDSDAFSTCACGLYDPALVNTAVGSVRLSCTCYLEDVKLEKNYLYRTIDGAATWDIQSMPGGDLHFISGQTYYATGREIYRTSDGGNNWNLVKSSVNWDGQFSFIDLNNALVVAYDPDDDQYALVVTSNGCRSFDLIIPELLASQSIR